MSNKTNWRYGAASLLAISTAAVSSQAVHAQEVEAEPGKRTLDAITVTATKRDETLQDVPVSVGAVPAATIDKLGATDISDLTAYIPNFQLNNSTVLPNLYVRGLGSGATHSIEQSVGRFVDEVYIGRAAMNLHGLFDVNSVEVLRGPQGTLFGKNTAAGALIVRTGKPTDSFEAGLDLSYGSYSTVGDNKTVQGFVSGPLAENLRGRLAVRHKVDDGYYINRLEGKGPDGPEREDNDIRLKLEWDASPNTVIGVSLENKKFNAVGADAAEMTNVGGPPTHLGAILDASPNFTPELDWVIDLDCTAQIDDINGDGILDGTAVASGGENFGEFCPSRDQETSTASFRVDHDFDGVGTFTWLSAYQKYAFDHKFHGIDMGATGAFRATRNEEFEGTSHEVRFTSDIINDKLDYIVGAYYEDSDMARDQFSDINFVGAGLGPIVLQRNEPWSQSTETLAVFGQVRYDFTDQFRAILGGRYANETKDFEFNRFFNVHGTRDVPLPTDAILGPFDEPLPNPVVDSRSESKFSPSVTVQYRPSDELNFFATYSQGHKTGGFSDRVDRVDADIEFDAETNDAFEIGMKSQLFDGRVNVNVALFNMAVEGLQLATQVAGSGEVAVPAFAVSNAAEVTSQGLELDARWLVNDDWTVGLDFAYTDASYDDFKGTPDCADEFRVDGVCDLSGVPLIFSPETKGNIFAEYYNDSSLGDWGFGARADINYSGEYYTDIAYKDGSFEDGYTIYNASARIVSPDENYTISLVGKNLTEEVVLNWGIPSGPNTLAALRKPREIILKFSARY